MKTIKRPSPSGNDVHDDNHHVVKAFAFVFFTIVSREASWGGSNVKLY